MAALDAARSAYAARDDVLIVPIVVITFFQFSLPSILQPVLFLVLVVYLLFLFFLCYRSSCSSSSYSSSNSFSFPFSFSSSSCFKEGCCFFSLFLPFQVLFLLGVSGPLIFASAIASASRRLTEARPPRMERAP